VKIGVLSDTHLTKVTEEFKEVLRGHLSEVDMIIHCGDITSLSVYEYLSNWDLRAVRGNMDDLDLKAILPEKRAEEIGGFRIGIVHGRGGPHGIERVVLGEFREEAPDVIVFGHSHVPLLTKIEGVTLFNPGAYRGSFVERGTIGLIEIKGGLSFRHIRL